MRWEIGRNSRGWVKFCLAYLLITNVCVMNLFLMHFFNFTTKKFFFFFVKSFFVNLRFTYLFHNLVTVVAYSGVKISSPDHIFRRFRDGRLPPIFEKYPEPGFWLPQEYDNVSNLQNRYIWNCEPATAFFFKSSSFFFLAKVIFFSSQRFVCDAKMGHGMLVGGCDDGVFGLCNIIIVNILGQYFFVVFFSGSISWVIWA